MNAKDLVFEERRVSGDRVMVDASTDRRLRGRPIVFNSISKIMLDKRIGPFRERMLPSSVDRVLSSGRDVKALWNHNESEVLGSRRSGTSTLAKTPQGLMIDINPPTWANRHLETVGRGDVDGMSFAFLVPSEGEQWDWRTDDGVPLRTVSDMDFREISIVTFPAYEDTSVEVSQRSIENCLLLRPSGAAYNWRPKFAEMMKQA